MTLGDSGSLMKEKKLLRYFYTKCKQQKNILLMQNPIINYFFSILHIDLGSLILYTLKARETEENSS